MMALNFDQFAQEGNHYMNALTKKLGYAEDRQRTARVLRAVLNTLRAMLAPSENMQLMSQLPMFLKAVYVDGYSLRETIEKPHHIGEFLARVKGHNSRTARHDFMNEDDVENAVRIVISSLRQYISLGEMEDIIAQLPKDIKQLISRSVMWI